MESYYRSRNFAWRCYQAPAWCWGTRHRSRHLSPSGYRRWGITYARVLIRWLKSLHPPGHATIGGLGPTSRQWGSTLDHVREVEVVLADGTITRANETQNPDLYFVRDHAPHLLPCHNHSFLCSPRLFVVPQRPLVSSLNLSSKLIQNLPQLFIIPIPSSPSYPISPSRIWSGFLQIGGSYRLC